MQLDKVWIRCDVCGHEFTVDKGFEDGYRYRLPMLSSIDYECGFEKLDDGEVDLCGACIKRAAVIRMVVETREGYIGGHDMYGRIPTGHVKYSFIEEATGDATTHG